MSPKEAKVDAFGGGGKILDISVVCRIFVSCFSICLVPENLSLTLSPLSEMSLKQRSRSTTLTGGHLFSHS